jgi:hypothetical protein
VLCMYFPVFLKQFPLPCLILSSFLLIRFLKFFSAFLTLIFRLINFIGFFVLLCHPPQLQSFKSPFLCGGLVSAKV